MFETEIKSYHLPRWPLFRQTIRCFLWGVAGILLLNLPYTQYIHWIGVLPLAWCVLNWFFVLSAKWHYVIRTDLDNLYIGKKTYPWSEISELKFDREGDSRLLILHGRSGLRPYHLTIKDDIVRFDEFAQECFWNVNSPKEQAESSWN